MLLAVEGNHQNEGGDAVDGQEDEQHDDVEAILSEDVEPLVFDDSVVKDVGEGHDVAVDEGFGGPPGIRDGANERNVGVSVEKPHEDSDHGGH